MIRTRLLPALAVLTLALGACNPGSGGAKSTQAGAKAGLPDGDPALARRLVRDEGALLLDVRSAGEFEGGHVEGAKNITHTEVPARVDEIVEWQGGDKDKPIVVYCRAGRRAGFAKEALLEAGFTNVSNLGGMSAWCEDC